MRKLFLVAIAALVFSVGCEISPTTYNAFQNTEGELVFRSASFQIFRVHINGQSYLVNSRGGIVLEPKK